MIEFTDKEIREKVAYWQKRLLMVDWEVELFILDGLPGALEGSITCNAEQRIMRIWLDRKSPDVEFVLVHEVVHSLLWYQNTDEPYDVLQEQAINSITAGLLGRLEKQ